MDSVTWSVEITLLGQREWGREESDLRGRGKLIYTGFLIPSDWALRIGGLAFELQPCGFTAMTLGKLFHHFVLHVYIEDTVMSLSVPPPLLWGLNEVTKHQAHSRHIVHAPSWPGHPGYYTSCTFHSSYLRIQNSPPHIFKSL